MIDLCKEEHITGEFVTTMLRENRGSREGLLMDKKAQDLAYQALADRQVVDILISDGQCDATMKGFGDCRDDIPCILELVEKQVLSLSDAVATMTCNPAKLFHKRTGIAWWDEKIGHLGAGALANVTVIDRTNKSMMYTICNGEITGFEKRAVRRGIGAGGFCYQGRYGEENRRWRRYPVFSSAIDMNKDRLVEILRQLIEVDTTNPPGNEKGIVTYLRSLFQDTLMTELIHDEQRSSLIVEIGSSVKERPTMTFIGHMDTVPYSQENWRYPPLKATESAGRIYGGAAHRI